MISSSEADRRHSGYPLADQAQQSVADTEPEAVADEPEATEFQDHEVDRQFLAPVGSQFLAQAIGQEASIRQACNGP